MSDEVPALVRAFAGDPILAWWQGERAEVLRERMFEELICRAARSRQLFVYGSAEGALAICAWAHKRRGWRGTLQQAVASFIVYRRFARSSKLCRLAWTSYALAKMLPTGDFLHIQYLMVNETARGGGLGARLLADIVAKAKSKNVLCYGDVSSREIDYFRRRGGKAISRCELPWNGPKITGLRFDD